MDFERFLIAANGQDQYGLIADLTGALYDQGANLSDSGFTLIGDRFEFHAVADFGGGVTQSDIESALEALETLKKADFSVMPYAYGTRRDEGAVTHLVYVEGGNRPGLVARMSEVLTDFRVNIVRMHAEKRESKAAIEQRYYTQFHVCVPVDRAEALSNALNNMAGSLRLDLEMVAY